MYTLTNTNYFKFIDKITVIYFFKRKFFLIFVRKTQGKCIFMLINLPTLVVK